jgi:ATP-dependent protease ClpP protease subunit
MQATDTAAEIVIYDEIGKSFWGEETVSAKSFLDSLTALGDVGAITLRINSPGGDVFDGVAIHNAIRAHKATVTAHIDGIAASMASYIAMAADRIVMPANAFMLVHNASGLAWGSADDMREMAADLDRIDKAMTATYATRSGSTPAKMRALMKEDRLMDAKEAMDLGLADEVVAEKKMAAKFSLRLLPKAAAERFRAETGNGQSDPPPSAPVPEKPEEQPAVPPVSHEPPTPADPPAPPPASPPAATVVDLNAARAEGIEEHREYVSSVTDLCTLASAPDRVGAYIRANTPLATVRKELLEMRATESVLPQHPLAQHMGTKAASAAWEKITDKMNARNK